MSIVRSSSGKLWHYSFAGLDAVPAGWTEELNGAGAITFDGEGAFFTSPALADYAYIVMDEQLDVSAQPVIRTVSKLITQPTNNSEYWWPLLVQDVAVKPTGHYAEGVLKPGITFYCAAGVARTRTAHDGIIGLIAPLALDTYYGIESELQLTDTRARSRLYDSTFSTSLADPTAYETAGYQTYSYPTTSDQPWVLVGDTRNDKTNGQMKSKYIQAMSTLDISIVGLSNQYAARLFDQCGNVIAQGLAGDSKQQTVTGYTITARQAPEHDQAPNTWTFEGSNNPAGGWTVLDTQNAIVFAGDEKKSYAFANTTGYRYYRLNVSANNGDANYLGLKEMELLVGGVDVVPLMDSSKQGSVFITASTVNNDYYSQPFRAFDDSTNNSSRWMTANGSTTGWIQVDFGADNSTDSVVLNLSGIEGFDTYTNPDKSQGGLRGFLRVYASPDYNDCLGQYPSEGYADDIWGGDEYEFSDSTRCCFVDYPYSLSGGGEGEKLLEINEGDYCIDEIEFPPPDPRIEYLDPAHKDGRTMSRYKHENREITLRGHVYGSDVADLASNIHALFHELYRSNPVLEWRPAGWAESLFFDLVNPPTDENTDDWFSTPIRDNPFLRVLSNFEIVCEAQPYARGYEREIVCSRQLAEDGDLEYWDAVPALGYWDMTSVGGAIIGKDGANQYTGTWCVQFVTPGGGPASGEIASKHFIPVDETKHYTLKLVVKKLSGTTAFDIDVACYDDGYNLLATLTMLVGDDVSTSCEDPLEKSLTDASTYFRTGGVISPSSEIADPFPFPVGTEYVKLVFRSDAAVASAMIIDRIMFTESEHFNSPRALAATFLEDDPIHKYENPSTIEITPDEISGDVPAPVRLFVSNVENKAYYGAILLGYAFNDYPDASYMWKARQAGLAVTDDISFYQQSWVRNTGAANRTFPLCPLKSFSYLAEKNYYGIVKCRKDVAGDDTSLVMPGITAANDTQNWDTTNWIISGVNLGAGDYHDPFNVFHMMLNLDISGDPTLLNQLIMFWIAGGWVGVANVDFDFVLFVPDGGFMRINQFSGANPSCFTVENGGLYIPYGMTTWFSEYEDGEFYKTSDSMYISGDAYPMISPSQHTAYGFALTTSGTRYGVGPKTNSNISLYYSPRFLIVPDE